jgi:hypothetical protein
MAKPNYSFEKRQRELAKKKKKEEKAREKAERKTSPGQAPDGQSENAEDGAQAQEGAAGQAPA